MEKIISVSDRLSYDDNAILGKGTAGFVFRGSFGDDIPVAVKRVKLASMQKEAVQKREEEMFASLDHPNVIKLYHIEEDLTFKYFALELCAASLDQCCLADRDSRKYKGFLPPDHEVLLQLANGLEYIHSRKLLHRDIKPENVLISLTEPALVKWSDFGLCKPLSKKEAMAINGIKATHYWTAPEILDLENQHPSSSDPDGLRGRGTVSSDIYALGLVFFSFLTNGLHLFGSKNLIIPNIMRGKSVNLSKLGQTHFAHEIICNMTKLKPEERWALSGVISILRPHENNSRTFHIEDSGSL
ncbi:Uncharacterized protein APZ42_016109 [Daphnia magna]|uniref:Uncharacterized protein n=2 Tax=Daphnia magna TaxID=35525 RepID=A0ABQ9YWG8_9CRUS|nr:hypothetical protein OUZ56_006719 [Daphnia magna]KZS18103.1 Uncharacterized protein APZ42_016109 [Daphnia magna]